MKPLEDGYYTYRDEDLRTWRVLEVRDGMVFFFGLDYPFDVEKLDVEIGLKIQMPRYDWE